MSMPTIQGLVEEIQEITKDIPQMPLEAVMKVIIKMFNNILRYNGFQAYPGDMEVSES